ncbi:MULTISPECIES: hypothetical protein [Enterococcus]|uniref:hypothetical protein n=1 Tax=Enterococcus TaxID=1350 RepID=UPI0010DD7FB7|nr:Uncharacterised protein [Enterococcus casseliflavus]
MSEFIKNTAGAKIYTDASKHEPLEFKDEGTSYNVLSAGFINPKNSFDKHPIVTVSTDKGPVAYTIPQELTGWVIQLINFAQSDTAVLPEIVEFGRNNGNVYAEIK